MNIYNSSGLQCSPEEYTYALQQQNLVYNHDFRYFSNQVKNGSITVYGTPDGWVYTDTGRNGTIDFSSETAVLIITKSQDQATMRFSQALHEFPRWRKYLRGRTVSGSVYLEAAIDGDVTVTLTDGISTSGLTRSLRGAQVFDLQLQLGSAADCLLLCIETSVPFMVLKISSCFVNIGAVAIPYLPCIITGVIGERKQYIATEYPPEGELSLCMPSQELDAGYTRLNSVLNYRFGKGTNGYSLLPDMRGYFSRAWDNSAGTDPDAKERETLGKGLLKGDHVGTREADAFLRHKHPLSFTVGPVQSATGGSGPVTSLVASGSAETKEALDGKETRPKNITELYTIKWA